MDRYRKLTREGREELQEIILEVIHDVYGFWKKDVRMAREYGLTPRSEPCVNAAYLFGDFEQRRMFPAYHMLIDTAQRREIHHALLTLHRKGMLNRSVGESMFGRESFCYEPGDI